MRSLVQQSPPQMTPGAMLEAGAQDGDEEGPTLERQGVVRESRQVRPCGWGSRREGPYRPSANGALGRSGHIEPVILEGEDEEAENEEGEAEAQPSDASAVEDYDAAGLDASPLGEEAAAREGDDADADVDAAVDVDVDADVEEDLPAVARRRLFRGASTSAVAGFGALSVAEDLGAESAGGSGEARAERRMRLRGGRTASLDAEFRVRLEGNFGRKGEMSAEELLCKTMDGIPKRRVHQEGTKAPHEAAAVIRCGSVRIEDGLAELELELEPPQPTACSLNAVLDDVCELIAGLRACEARHKEAQSGTCKVDSIKSPRSHDAEAAEKPSPRKPRHLWRASRSVSDAIVDGYDADADKDARALKNMRRHHASADERTPKGWAALDFMGVHTWPKAHENSNLLSADV